MPAQQEIQKFIYFYHSQFIHAGNKSQHIITWLQKALQHSGIQRQAGCWGWRKDTSGKPGIQVEEEMATHSSILAWEIPWSEEPGRLQSMGLQESDETVHTSSIQGRTEINFALLINPFHEFSIILIPKLEKDLSKKRKLID